MIFETTNQQNKTFPHEKILNFNKSKHKNKTKFKNKKKPIIIYTQKLRNRAQNLSTQNQICTSQIN